MNRIRCLGPSGTFLSLIGLLSLVILTGCKRDDTSVYQVPKDDSVPTDQAASPTAPPPAVAPTSSDASLPRLGYQMPAGWQSKPPSEMRVASFTAAGPGGRSADISVIPLGIVGRDLELVNMWRSQVRLPASSDPDVVSRAKTVPIGAGQGRLFEFVSDQPLIGPDRKRLTIAVLVSDNTSWYFKIEGPDQAVAAQKDNFLRFLQSVTFGDSAPPSAATTPDASAPGGNSVWTVPDGWQATAPSQFLLAEYAVTGSNGTKAEVNAAELDGEGGGPFANINRWRGQLGLEPMTDDDLVKIERPLGTPDGDAIMVDLTGTDAKTGGPTRLIGVIVPHNGHTWFYKLMGDKQAVAQQENNFVQFIQSANYANAR
ncbi:MAG: hypothetical protein LV479_12035 [Methylacidiphilales bacterium]|nr:hypothetical protein [Candidatus Methylacidiphilales bacterium]